MANPFFKLNTLPDRKKRSPLLDGIIVVRQDEHPGQQDAIWKQSLYRHAEQRRRH
jgi:hypothetical protein